VIALHHHNTDHAPIRSERDADPLLCFGTHQPDFSAFFQLFEDLLITQKRRSRSPHEVGQTLRQGFGFVPFENVIFICVVWERITPGGVIVKGYKEVGGVDEFQQQFPDSGNQVFEIHVRR